MFVRIGSVEFSWSDDKNTQNIKKHGVSFEEALTIFLGFPLRVVYDPDHSDREDRYIAIGISVHSRILIVVHCESANGISVRIISARKATKNEQRSLSGEKK